MQVSVITTLLNEANSIHQFLDSLLTQARSPDEIVLCDGGSTDGTVEIIEKYIAEGAPLRLLIIPGANRAVGRNAATRAARHDVIACTDVGCWLHRDWLKNIVEPFETAPSTMVVAGFFRVVPQTLLEEGIATLTGFPPEGTDSDRWLPSSRSIAYRRVAWEKAGGYPEQFSFNEDTPFDISLKKAGFHFVKAPDAWVYWRPRSTLQGFFRQYHAYARGDGQGLINLEGYSLRTAIYIGGAILILLNTWVPGIWMVAASGFALYLLRRMRRAWRLRARWPVFLIVPLLAVVNDLADLSGYWRGVAERTLSQGKWM
jgi:glycosyltransferase involved in cell wall biosynthesis